MTRVSLAFCAAAALTPALTADADLARLDSGSANPTSKAAESSGVQLTRLMPSYTVSFLESVNTPDNDQSLAQYTQGAVHLGVNQVFYAALALVDANPGGGLGPGGDGSVDHQPPDGPPGPPPPSRVPTPNALLLGVIGIALVDQVHCRRRPLLLR